MDKKHITGKKLWYCNVQLFSGTHLTKFGIFSLIYVVVKGHEEIPRLHLVTLSTNHVASTVTLPCFH